MLRGTDFLHFSAGGNRQNDTVKLTDSARGSSRDRLGLGYARRLRRQRGRLGDTWHLDELFVTIQGQRQYLWRAVDQDGHVIDMLVQSRRGRALLL